MSVLIELTEKQLELKMFYQTYTALKPPSACTPVTPGGHGMVPSAARILQRTAHALQCIVNGDDAAVFPVLSLVTLTFDL